MREWVNDESKVIEVFGKKRINQHEHLWLVMMIGKVKKGVIKLKDVLGLDREEEEDILQVQKEIGKKL